MKHLALLMIAATAGCAVTPAQIAADEADAAEQFAEVTEGRVAGAAEQCISTTSVDGPQVIGRDKLAYRETGRRVWVTTIEGCPPLDRDPIVVAELYGSQICRNDRFRTLIRGGATIPGPVCRFGTFVPYVRPAS